MTWKDGEQWLYLTRVGVGVGVDNCQGSARYEMAGKSITSHYQVNYYNSSDQTMTTVTRIDKSSLRA